MKVINMNGTEINYEAAVAMMDDEIRESICGTVDTEQEFFSAYEKAHIEKYGEEWARKPAIAVSQLPEPLLMS